MTEKWLVGVDVGGTTTKMAFITEIGDIVKKWEINTNTKDAGKHITTEIANSITEQLQTLGQQKQMLIGIGVGAPGFIDMETGFIYKAVNIGWENFPLKDELEQATGLPVIVDNDANIAAVGEMWRGAGDKAEHLLCVTLGTGVGGGVIVNGEILHGVNGMAGEIGHLTSIAEGGAPCNCGKTGCLETIASATGISRLAKEGIEKQKDSLLYTVNERKGEISAKDVFEAAKGGDELAIEVVKSVSLHLGLAIANLANALNPEKIVIGGGVSNAGDILLTHVQDAFQRFALSRAQEGVEVTIATLGNDAGVIGGAFLAKTSHDKS
ncbi:ROK family glucokinase [Desertibacillus haloalkaliphilus]|uniref:ROK family glucokinase n=1 Tax=Desertibacillus haloalkaliphilus TaxID=1328930 RepID=UPI001C280441|nr:ROK family glucokinase [Desertibacillus haloalkaliphilus]MBU8905735.1 ROK family glucokinase [Desertibacillus haloalkaliphilus]